jgi:hypothetical protein
MQVERSIRAMTPQERQAKREWGTGACQVRGCTARAAYLLLETPSGKSEDGDWWQYCCAKHARAFVDQHGLEMPAAAARASRSLAVQ